ncbi:MAG: protein FxsA [Aliidongia sp.]|nr:protein FxsA [Aliidongia sp.]
MPLVILLLLWPLAEIAGFVWIGDAIGVGPTLAFVLLSGLLGLALLRRASLATLRHFRANLEAGKTPVPAALDGMWRLLAGLLLVVPGFLSSGMALLLSIPVVRTLLTRAVAGLIQTGTVRVQTVGFETPLRREAGPTVIEGEFRELPDRRI